jgi:hypothetical protein
LGGDGRGKRRYAGSVGRNAVFCFADRFNESFRNETDVVAEEGDGTNGGWRYKAWIAM